MLIFELMLLVRHEWLSGPISSLPLLGQLVACSFFVGGGILAENKLGAVLGEKWKGWIRAYGFRPWHKVCPAGGVTPWNGTPKGRLDQFFKLGHAGSFRGHIRWPGGAMNDPATYTRECEILRRHYIVLGVKGLALALLFGGCLWLEKDLKIWSLQMFTATCCGVIVLWLGGVARAAADAKAVAEYLTNYVPSGRLGMATEAQLEELQAGGLI
jgi:hypothetical protein